jgi:tetratricopeptide (TPR) repeat protein
LAVRLLVVCTARPELFGRAPAFSRELANAKTLNVRPLSDAETAELVGGLLDRAVLPPETQRLLLERAGGNPLHAEEFVRMLRDRGLLDQQGRLASDAEITVPESIQALIAARLDTLPADRKRLLQDAAVIGKVFWAGAVATMAGREAADVEQALADLSSRELIRPATRSSMEGENEYGFWHALIRDAAYAQIPRRERARRHLQAVDWLKDKAGDRVEDIAEVLAHHTGEALGLAQVTRNTELEAKVRPAAARYALLAGERALGLNTGKAVELLERARELIPEDDPASAPALLRWVEAVEDSGRLQEAGEAVERAAVELEARGDAFNAGQAWSRLGFIHRRLARPDFLALHERAVRLLEPTPGPELVAALAEYADGLFVSEGKGFLQLGIVIADRARTLAEDLGLPEPGWALGARGCCRCELDDPGGIGDLERAIRLLEQAGDRRAVFVIHNLAHYTSRREGPAAAVDDFERVIALASARGAETMVHYTRGNRISALIKAGRLTEAVEESDALLPVARHSGDRHLEINLLFYRLAALLELGADATAASAEQAEVLASSGRDWPAARALVSLACGDRAALASALQEVTGLYLGDAEQIQPRLIRAAASLGDLDLFDRLVAGLPRSFPQDRHNLAVAAALRTEMTGDDAGAAVLYADLAEQWAAFTAVLEQAYALLGQGRALARISEPAFEVPLSAARSLFERMGAGRGLAECDAVLARGGSPASSARTG